MPAFETILYDVADGIATICGDVIYDFNDQIVNPFHEIADHEPRVTGNHGTSKRDEKAAMKKILNSSKFLLPIHDKPNFAVRSLIVTLAINLDDDEERARDVSRRLSLSIRMLFDPAKETGRLFQVDSMPTTLFIDREGVVRYAHGAYRPDSGETYQQQLRKLLDE